MGGRGRRPRPPRSRGELFSNPGAERLSPGGLVLVLRALEPLGQVQRIKAEGDYEAAVKLFETYGVHFDARLRDEVVARVDRLKMPSYTGFVQPRLTAATGADGKVTDVTISYPMDLSTQMLEYSGRRK